MRHILVRVFGLLSLISFSTIYALPGEDGTNPPVGTSISVPSTDSDGNYTVSWSSFGATSYTLYEYASSWSSIYSGSGTSKAISGKSDGTYTYYVQACNAYGCSTSANQSVVVSSGPVAPSTPSAPTVSPTTTNTGDFSVTWTQPSGTVTSYDLQEQANSGSWTTIQTGLTGLSSAFTSKTVGSYRYKVRACNQSNCSSYSSQSSLVTVNQASSIPDAPLVTPMVPANQNVGALEGSAGVSGGSAKYNIPIAIPPGRNGMQPNVSLNYSSRTGNGIAGVGWSLSAGSSIHRCGMIADIDGYNGSATYSSSKDKLCLDGKRLIVTSGSYGVSGAQYRTEEDSFAKVTQYGYLNSSTTWFKVEYKSGRVGYYGDTSNSRHLAAGKSSVLRWAIGKELDRATTANAIHYNYGIYGAGEYLLNNVKYTGTSSIQGNREVTFYYENRPDDGVSYLAGGKVLSTKRLNKITTRYAGSLVREYELTYQTSVSQTTRRSILQSVTECSYDEFNVQQCLPATTLETYTPSLGWEAPNANPAVLSNVTMSAHDRVRMKDLNGDGIAEAMHLKKNGSTYDVKIYEIENGNYQIISANTDTYSHELYTGIEGDVNGDGITDFIVNVNGQLKYIQFDKYLTTLTMHNAGYNGYGFSLTSNYDRLEPGQGVSVVDLNGDGYQDIVFTNLGISGQFHVAWYRNKANGHADFHAAQNLYNLSYRNINNWTKVHQSGSLMDMNGDGLMDLVMSYQKTDSLNEVTIAFSARNSNGDVYFNSPVTPGTLNLPTNLNLNQYTWGDVNGDGLKDIIYAAPSGGSHYWYIRLNEGDGTFATAYSTWSTVGIEQVPVGSNSSTVMRYQAYAGGLRVADFDGDGREELLVATGSDDSFCVNATGSQRNDSGNHVAFIHLQSCNDAIHLPEHQNTEEGANLIKADLAKYDMRRLNWTVIDFKVNGNYMLIDRYLFDVVKAPNTSYVWLDGTAVGPLEMYDSNNDGALDFYYRTQSGFSYNSGSNLFSLGGMLINGFIAGSFSGTPPANAFYIQHNLTADATKQQDTVAKVTDGLGRESQWDYATLSSDPADFYTIPDNRYISNDPYKKHFYFTSSMSVVKDFHLSDGIGGTNTTSYRYKEAIYNRMGRGFQGFRTIIVDNPNGQRAVSDFHQIFPLAGKIESVRSCLVSESKTCSTNPISESISSYSVKNTIGSNVYWIVPTSTTSTQYAEDDRVTQLSSKTTTIAMADTDDYGNIKKSITTLNDGFSIVKTTTQSFYYSHDTSSWWINKLNYQDVQFETLSNNSSVYNGALDSIKKVRTTTTWTTNRQPDLVTRSVLQGGGATTSVDTNYNSYGLPIQITTTESNKPSRIVSMTYSNNGTSQSADGYFVYTATNPLNHSVTIQTAPEHGQTIAVTDANSQTVKTRYDPFGRVEEISPPIGTGQPVYTRYAWCQGGCDAISNSAIAYKVTHYSAGTPESTVYKDMMNRNVLTKTEGFDGNPVYSRKEYDDLGRTTFESIPSTLISETVGTSYIYNHVNDPMGRITQKVVPQDVGNMTVTYTYTGHKTGISANTLTMSRTYSGTGKLMQTTDAKLGVTQYAFDAMGNPIVLSDANGEEITAEYNALGQKEYVDDPNMGYKSFTYEYGQVKSETDDNNLTTSYTIDKLNRITHRYENGTQKAFFAFDTECKGLPDSETSYHLYSGSYSKQYDYDQYCRLEDEKSIIDGMTYTLTTQYDGNYGRTKAFEYPTGLIVKQEYNDRGYLDILKNANSGYVYEEVTKMSHWGKVTEMDKADSTLREFMEYSPNTGQMTLVRAQATLGGNQRHRIDYVYGDGFGNLTKQTAYNTSTNTSVEDYQYDELHRLTNASRSINNGSVTESTGYSYDAVGNFTYKSDYANSFTYGNASKSINNAGPNAVRYVSKVGGGSATFAYDLNGNMTSGNGRILTYNAFNKPLTISKSGVTSRFWYGANQMRYKQQKTGLSGGTETTYYVGKTYEKVVQSGVIKEKVYFGDTIITTTTGGSSAGTEKNFVHRDRLGSVVTITDENGDVVDNKSYDAFGKPRKGDMMSVSPATLKQVVSTNSLYNLKTNRGFTEHEHLDEVELIHMNGRAYDYNLGRFLSVDPFIQAPGNSQSMNPYSYIMNNPLAGTDPSGYIADTTLGGLLDENCITVACQFGHLTAGFTTANGNESTFRLKNKLEKDTSSLMSNKDYNFHEVAPEGSGGTIIISRSGALNKEGFKNITLVDRNSNGDAMRGNDGKIVSGSVENLSENEREFLSLLDTFIFDYVRAIQSAKDTDALTQFERTDWFYDPSNPSLAGDDGNIAEASYIYPDINYSSTKFDAYNKGRNWIRFGNKGISYLRTKRSQYSTYHGWRFSGGKWGLLEIVAHEAGHTIPSNTYYPRLSGKRPQQLIGDMPEKKANAHMSNLRRNHFPKWYQE